MKHYLPLAALWLLGLQPASTQNAAYPDTTFTNYFRRESGWTAGDATLSIPLPNNKVLWLFGDSYIDNYNPADTSLPCMFQVRNAAMLQTKSNPNQMTTLLDYSQSGINRTLFKLSNNELPYYYFWPGHGYVHGDTVYIFLQRYHTPQGSSQINHVGTYLAKMLLPNLELVGIYALPATDGIFFGRWVFVPVNGNFVFVYGNKVHDVPFGNGTLKVWKPYVARVPINNPMGPWQFRTSNSWSNDPAQAAPISTHGVSPGFSVLRRDGDLYLITQQNGYLQCGSGREIYSIKGGAAPWEPFTSKQTIYVAPDQYNGQYLLTYNAYVHPSWNRKEGLLISYNVNDHSDTSKYKNCPSQCFYGNTRNADTYRPKFIRLPWSALTGNGLAPSSNGHAAEKAAIAPDQILQLRCFPNPASDHLQVTFELPSATPVFIEVRSLTGQIVYAAQTVEQVAGEHNESIELDRWPPGVYILRVQAAGQEVAQKIVKQ